MQKFLSMLAIVAICASSAMANATSPELTVVAPMQAMAGKAFTVNVIIKAPGISGFTRFFQDLPKGFVAEPISPDDSYIFAFSGDEDMPRLRIIWANFPNSSEVRLSYLIRATDSRLHGKLSLAGTFSYLVDTTRLAVNATPITVDITSTVDSLQSIDIQSYQHSNVVPVAAAVDIAAINAAKVAAAIAKVPSSSLFAIRQKPYMVDKEYYVNILVNKSTLNGFGKVEESLLTPVSKVVPIETKGANFSIEGNKVNFLWLSALPADSDFVIAYKVVPNGAPLSIKGVCTFNNGGRVENINVVERNVDYSRFVPVPPLAAAESEAASAASPAVAPVPSKPQARDLQHGLVFKVQLLAAKQSLGNVQSINDYFSQYGINEPVVEDIQGEINAVNFAYKYSMGPFKTYDQASGYRDQVWKKGATDAFVTCYYNGKRITIQEALMITNKK